MDVADLRDALTSALDETITEIGSQLDVARDALLSLGWGSERIERTLEGNRSWQLVLVLDAAAYVSWGRRRLVVFEVTLGDDLAVRSAWIVAHEALPRPST